MGIFEQYGIKEIADVTLYAITENKYGEEIYVPLIYFDTLKVSDIEQAAEQTSARGGLGNSHQVFWDYNKEVSIKLVDALYNSTNQSLTWGNYLGITPLKLEGIWTPEDFEIQKVVVDTIPQGEEDKYVKFICPCDNVKKYYTYKIKVNRAAARLTQDEISYGNNKIKLDGRVLQDVQSYNEISTKQKQKGQLIVKNFLNFSQDYAEFSENDLISHWRLFNWSDCEGEIVAEETIAIDDIDLAVFSNENTDNIMFLIKNFSAKDTVGWSSKISVQKVIYKKLIGLGDNDQPIEKLLPLKVHFGDFYIIEDWNINNLREETIPYQIDLNCAEVPYLDKIEKKQVKKDFKIDTNKNILAYNAFLIKEYEKKNLTCYLDPETMRPYQSNNAELKDDVPTSYHYFKEGEYYLKKTRSQADDSKRFLQTLIKMNQFNGMFRIVGETYTRDRIGEDQCYQIEIPKCKMQTSNNLNLSSDGETNIVDMNFIALPSYNGKILSLTRYEKEVTEDFKENYSRPILVQPLVPKPPIAGLQMKILYPLPGTEEQNAGILCIPNDCRVENSKDYINGGSRLILPLNQSIAQSYFEKISLGQWNEIPKDLLLVGIYNENDLIQYLTQNDNSVTISIKNIEKE